MLLIFPILIFTMLWSQIISEYQGLQLPIMTVVLTVLCSCLLLVDICSVRDYSLYWAHMFIVWSLFLTGVSVVQMNTVDFQIGCWVFSAIQWQLIRIILQC